MVQCLNQITICSMTKNWDLIRSTTQNKWRISTGNGCAPCYANTVRRVWAQTTKIISVIVLSRWLDARLANGKSNMKSRLRLPTVAHSSLSGLGWRRSLPCRQCRNARATLKSSGTVKANSSPLLKTSGSFSRSRCTKQWRSTRNACNAKSRT